MKRQAILTISFFIIITSLLATEIVSAKTTTSGQLVSPDIKQSQGNPVIIKAGIYVLNIGALDISKGTFTIDFYLSFTSDMPSDPNDFELCNGTIDMIEQTVDEENEKFYHIHATISNNLQLKRYPLDRHRLTIEIEDKYYTNRSQIYEVNQDECGLDSSLVIPGWKLNGWQGEVKDHAYKLYNTEFSRLVFSLKIERPWVTFHF